MAALEAQPTGDAHAPEMEAAAPPDMPWWMQSPSVQRLVDDYKSKTDEERAEISRRAAEAEEEAFDRIAAQTPPGEPTAEGTQLRILAAARYMSGLQSVHENVPKQEELDLFADLISKYGLRIDYDAFDVARRKVLEAGGTPGFWAEALGATRFFSVHGRDDRGRIPVATLREATELEAESLCALAARAKAPPFKVWVVDGDADEDSDEAPAKESREAMPSDDSIAKLNAMFGGGIM